MEQNGSSDIRSVVNSEGTVMPHHTPNTPKKMQKILLKMVRRLTTNERRTFDRWFAADALRGWAVLLGVTQAVDDNEMHNYPQE